MQRILLRKLHRFFVFISPSWNYFTHIRVHFRWNKSYFPHFTHIPGKSRSPFPHSSSDTPLRDRSSGDGDCGDTGESCRVPACRGNSDPWSNASWPDKSRKSQSRRMGNQSSECGDWERLYLFLFVAVGRAGVPFPLRHPKFLR